MNRPFSPVIITANALESGEVVYLSENDGWSDDIRTAELIEDEAHAQLRLLAAQSDARAVGAYLTPARPGRNGPEPLALREGFRQRGPSNYPHGKQEKQKARHHV